jgi:ABC-type multidrug transport system ATPase subunit
VATTGLAKAFGTTRALDGLDLEVRPGEVHAFLGPNRAGKTTTLRVLLGLLRADAGQVAVLGRDPWSEASELRGLLAYVPGEVTLWPTVPGRPLDPVPVLAVLLVAGLACWLGRWPPAATSTPSNSTRAMPT